MLNVLNYSIEHITNEIDGNYTLYTSTYTIFIK